MTLAGIADDLGRLVPHLSLPRAMGYRIRRNYAYLFSVAGVAWLLKLEVHPVPAEGLNELVHRAAIGGIPGWGVFLGAAVLAIVAMAMGVRAPSEQMMNWTEVPSPLARWLARAPGPQRSRTPRNDP
jgi:uncharacterized membrane protein